MTLENTLETFNKNVRRLFRSRSVRVDALKKRIHVGVKCDHCGRENFEGDRLSCTICDNYNLCSECFCLGHSCCPQSHNHQHSEEQSDKESTTTSSSTTTTTNSIERRHSIEHPCLLVVHPVVENASSSSSYGRTPKLAELVDFYKDHDFNIVCNCCEKKILGVYFKCNKCYCTYLCYECWQGKKQHACFDPRDPHQMIVYKSKRLEKYDYKEIKLGCMIGNGNFGYVYEAMLKPVNNFVACKLLDKKFSQQNLLARINNKQENLKEKFASIDKELQAYVEIYSPFICKLFGYGRDRASNLFLVMEYMDNGTLEDLMIREKKGLVEISLRTKLSIMANIACGLADIHNKNLIHADVKPKNILIDSSYTAKICDLGSIKNANNNQFDNQIGGLFYLPLEFYLGKYDEKIDVYSFGLIMYHLFCGKRHSYSMNNALILDAINKVELKFVRSLIECATNFNIVERKSIYYYRNFLKNYLKLFDAILVEFDLAGDYEEQNVSTQNTLLICLSDYIVEYIHVNFSLKLELNGKVGLDSIGFKPEIKAKLERATKSLRRETNMLKFENESKLRNIESKASLIDFKLNYKS